MVSGPTGPLGPIRLVDVELGAPLAGLVQKDGIPGAGAAHDRIRILVRLHGHPLGTVSLDFPAEGLSAPTWAQAVWAELAGAIGDHLVDDGASRPTGLTASGLQPTGALPCSWQSALGATACPRASIVVTTCGGADSGLSATLDGALAQTYPCVEVVVVDNRPATSGVRTALAGAMAADERLRYAAEPRQGLSYARNRGAAVARGAIIAFTDDDVEIDRDWLGWLVAGFVDPAVGCVTGLILPAELETPAQLLLEEFGGYSKGFQRRIWDATDHRLANPLYPYTVGVFGSGANAAFRRAALDDIGGFDEALGAGTPARGGEDLDIYVTCIQRGYRILYEPSAIIRHAHLRELAGVHQKVRDYGVGLGAMLTKHLVRDWSSFAAILSRLPSGTWHLLSQGSPKNAARSTSYPSSLVRAELSGVLYGPLAYLRSRASSRSTRWAPWHRSTR
jgi:GT2 family glycosyltransferase